MSNEEKILNMLETQGRLLGEIATGQTAIAGVVVELRRKVGQG